MKKNLLVLAFAFGLFQLHQGGHLDAFLHNASSHRPDSTGYSHLSAQEQELHKTLQRISHNGPFPHQRDGITFENRERLLPGKPRGYYREYTVDTPGCRTGGRVG